MVPWGIIVYDDYGFSGCEGITRYVNEQIGKRDRLVLHNLNGHAVVVKTLSAI
jgi:O-methyltransferase